MGVCDMRLWVLMLGLCAGSLAQGQVTNTLPGNSLSYTRTSSFTYYPSGNPLYGLLETETVEPTIADLCVTTTYAYDGYGNKSAGTTSQATGCASGADASVLFVARTSSTYYATVSISTTTPALAIGSMPSVPLGGYSSLSAGASSTMLPMTAGAYTTAAVNAASHAETHQFEPRFGAAVMVTGPNGLTTTWQVDNFGRKVRETRADGTSTVMAYCYLTSSYASNSTITDISSNSSTGNTPADPLGCFSGTVVPDTSHGEVPANAAYFVHTEPHDASGGKMGPFARVYYDRMGRSIRQVTEGFDGSGQPGTVGTLVVQDTLYSQYGPKVAQTQPYFLITGSSTTTGASDAGLRCSVYDALGRVTRVYAADGNGQHTFPSSGQCSDAALGPLGLASSFSSVASGKATLAQYAFNSNGYTVTATDDWGNARSQEKDALGQVVRVTDPTGAQLVKVYDAFGNLTQTVDALGNTVNLSYDIRGRKVRMNDPDVGVWAYCFDALGQMIAQQNPNERDSNTAVSCPTVASSNGAALAPTVSTAYATTGSSGSTVMWTTAAFDVLGRVTQRVEPEYTSTWSFDSYAGGGTCTKGVGKLCEVVTTIGEDRKYVYDSLGRALNTLMSVSGKLGTAPSFAAAVAYDATTGRVKSQTYPSGLVVNTGYTAKGYVQNLTLGTPTSASSQALPATPGGQAGAAISLAAGSTLYTAVSIDAWGWVEQQSYGTGTAAVTDKASFDGPTGRTNTLTAASSGSSTSNVLNYSYVWDSLGNLKQRTDGNGDGSTGASVTEVMGYDTLNRLTSYTVAGVAGVSRQQTFEYNALGDMLYRSDLGVYGYPTQGASSVHPHAVASVGGTGASHNISYTYDLQGNLKQASGTGNLYKTITYTSFNLPDAVSGVSGANGSAYTWQYDENHARIRETRVDNTAAVSVTATGPSGTSSGAAAGSIAMGTRVTWYLHPNNAGGLGFEYEQTSATGTNLSRHYLSVGGMTIGVLEATGTLPAPTGTAPATIASITLIKVEYWHKDSLGSLVATTDHTGAVTDRYAYDPFGKRRYTTGAYDATGALVGDYTTNTSSGTARGFTGHEHLDEIGIINMNGRLYDQTTGRFMQADPMIEDPNNLFSYDRYAYCGNSPMGCVDPTGYCFLGCFWHGSHLAADWRQLWNNQAIRAIVIAVAAAETGGAAADWYAGVEGASAGEAGYAAASAAYAAGGSPAIAEAAAIGAETMGSSMVGGAVGGFVGGMLGSNGNLKAGLQGAAFGMANGFIGSTWTSGAFGNVAAHLVLGCVQGVAGHSNCGSGALSAGFTSLFERSYSPDPIAGGIEASIVGGTASVIGGGKFVNGAEVAAFSYLFNWMGHRADGKLWAVQPTADEYAQHYIDGTGETVYREGSDVNLGEYPSGQFVMPVGSVIPVYPSSVALAAGLVNWELGTLPPGALTDTFIYGSLGGVTVLGGGSVQLSPDTFNYDMEGRPFRDFMTWTQHQTLGQGLPGKNFQTIFVGPTKAP